MPVTISGVMTDLFDVTMYTDGASDPNPGPSGYDAVLLYTLPDGDGFFPPKSCWSPFLAQARGAVCDGPFCPDCWAPASAQSRRRNPQASVPMHRASIFPVPVGLLPAPTKDEETSR